MSTATLCVPHEPATNKKVVRCKAVATPSIGITLRVDQVKRRSEISAQACSGSSLSGAFNIDSNNSNLLEETREPDYGLFSLQSWVNESIY